MILRSLAILFGIAAFIGCSLVVGAWLSWLELSSEAYAFSDVQLAEMRQEHWSAFRLWGSVAVFGSLLAIAFAWTARKRAHVQLTKRSS